jgi:VCBS repeat-containing protein
MKKIKELLYCILLSMPFATISAQSTNMHKAVSTLQIDLSGEWKFRVDSSDVGIQNRWFNETLTDRITLPGSMATNGKGDDITVNTKWTGSIVDSSWFFKPEYTEYRKPGNIKIPFWLQPIKYYKGAAWYQKKVTIPASWKQKHIELFIERSHWETTVWIDDKQVGMDNSLGTPHVFDLSRAITPGSHRITVRVDNRVKDVDVGKNSHSISDHTQSNWNGMIGKLYVAARPHVYIDNVQLFPDLKNKEVAVQLKMVNTSVAPVSSTIELFAASNNPKAGKLKPQKWQVKIKADTTVIDAVYPMGNEPLLWDEFHPDLYSFTATVTIKKGDRDEKIETFGMRAFSTKGTQFTINGHLTFLRGTLECAIFPKTGFPPTDEKSWMEIFKVCRAYGLNHMRFHSWCPPEAAFKAADLSGFYIQVECSSWANQGTTIGDGKPLDNYIYDESRRMIQNYGNHPSFVMMLYGNEPAGRNHVKYLTGFVNYWKQRDSRRVYTTGAGWPVVSESNYNSTPDPRIQHWGEGVKSIINGKAPATSYDWSDVISKWDHPTVSHEIGQWCVYPDFKEMAKYTGVLKPKNFEIFRDKLANNGMKNLANSFLWASGKLQSLCYKADIEAALRTPGFAGFQLLDLHDFPGQGTALVGVLNPFWGEKGYITAKEYSRFCNSTVPLARFAKMIYNNNEQISVPVEIAHFGEAALQNVIPEWTITDKTGKVLFSGKLAQTNIPLGNGFKLGIINQSLSTLQDPAEVTLTVTVNQFSNSWNIFVYPQKLPAPSSDIYVTQQLDEKASEILNKGGSVLLTIKKGTVKPDKGGNVAIGFSSIFWNTAWTNNQPPHTLGILCDPKHPALKEFPSEYHSNWQWWDAMSHSNALRLDAVSAEIKPIVRVIDDWVTARPLGLIFECKTAKGKLLVSGIDLLTEQENRPEARQLLFSLENYMAGNAFRPAEEISLEKIKSLFLN